MIGHRLGSRGVISAKKGVERAFNPMRSFHKQLQDEIGSDERVKRGELGEAQSFEGQGQLFMGLRIAEGISQRESAGRLCPQMASIPYERKQYLGIKVEGANRLLEAPQIQLTSS